MKRLMVTVVACFIMCEKTYAVWNELHAAIYKKDAKEVAQILGKKYTQLELYRLLHAKTYPDRWTPLHCAVICGNNEITKKLLEYKARQDIYDSWGMLPIHYAASQQNIDACQLLLENGASIHDLTSVGETPLIVALKNRKILATYFLIGLGSNVKIVPLNGLTALYWANVHHYYSIVRLLLAKGANTVVKGEELPIIDFCFKDPIVRPIAEYAKSSVVIPNCGIIVKIYKTCWT